MADHLSPYHPAAMTSPGNLAVTVLLAAALTAAVGCSVRDERATAAGDGRWWTTPARPTAGLIGGGVAAPAVAPTIDYVDGFDAGARRAAESGAPMLVVFRAAWCRWSGELFQAAVADPSIVRLSRRFVCMAIDADRHADTCRRFGVRAFPTVLILDADGGERFRATGSAVSGDLAAALDAVLAEQPKPRRIAAGATDPAR